MNTDDKPKTAALGKKVVKTEGSSDDDSDFTHAVNAEDDPTTTKEKSDEPLRGDAIVKKKDNPDEDSVQYRLRTSQKSLERYLRWPRRKVILTKMRMSHVQ